MKKILFIISIFGLLFGGCSNESDSVILSPNGKVKINFNLSSNGTPVYSVLFNNKIVIDTSSMGFEFNNLPKLESGLKISSIESGSVSEVWRMPWGEQSEVKNNYNEKSYLLEETKEPNRKFYVHFKVYDDGIGFRYEFPKQPGMDSVIITNENTEFQLTGDHKAWWIPGDWDIYEHLYSTTKISKINALTYRNSNGLAQSYIPYNAVNTPVTMKTDDGLYLSFHEANLTNYAGMTLLVDNETYLLKSMLVGNDEGIKVETKTPFVTPWRTIQMDEKPGDLIESKLIVNLNEPNKLDDNSWIEPMKYVGIWWEMHLGKSNWDLASGKHGATTANAKKFIDFASENNIKGLLIEGWNTGWEHWIGFKDREGVFDFVTPYPDYDLDGVVRYAKEKGVKIIMHHETSAAPRTYEQQMDTAYALCRKLGIHSVKTGYVGELIPKGIYHHGQWMVRHYRKVLETAAKYQIMVDAHEPIKATGIRRTFPNAISREGLRGQEFNAWSADGGNPPEHLTIVPFTRMLAGPIDFTPGIFDIKFDQYKKNNQVNTTLAQQLALYVVIYSPLQMAADLPENYEGNPAFQFIRDVGVDWDKSLVLNGEIGEYITIARKEKGTNNWFLGSITNENARTLEINLDFLDDGKTYSAAIYKDAEDADWDKNPTAFEIEKRKVKKDDLLKLNLAPGGGTAISFIMD